MNILNLVIFAATRWVAAPRIFVCVPDEKAVLASVDESVGIHNLFTLGGLDLGSLTDSIKELTDNDNLVAVSHNADDLASIFYTSETISHTKGAMLSHCKLAIIVIVLSEYWHLTEDDVLIHALPIFHIHGLYVPINMTLMAGLSVLLHTCFDPADISLDMKRASLLIGSLPFMCVCWLWLS